MFPKPMSVVIGHLQINMFREFTANQEKLAKFYLQTLKASIPPLRRK